MADTDVLQARLNTISGKIQYLLAEKTRIEGEKLKLQAELKAAGIEDPSLLPEIIAKKQAELELTRQKFTETVTKFELKVSKLEEKVR
jgi:predicted nuclease with TOPRIM domain